MERQVEQASGSEVREWLSWEGYGQAARWLAEAVADSGYRPDIVLAVARGGLLIAGSLAYALGVKNVFVVSVEYYTGMDERLELPVFLPPPLNVVDIRDTKVLLADDVADTGATLQAVLDLCRPEVAEIRSAVLYEKPRTIVSPDYVWRRTDRWIEFPWSTASAVVVPQR